MFKIKTPEDLINYFEKQVEANIKEFGKKSKETCAAKSRVFGSKYMLRICKKNGFDKC